MSQQLSKDIFHFLVLLKENNNRDWMQEHKTSYLANEKMLKAFYTDIEKGLNTF